MLTYISKARQGWVSGEHPGYQAYDDNRKLTIGEENEMRTKLGMSPVSDNEPKDNFQDWFNKQFAPAMEAYNKQIESRGTFAETISKPEGEECEVYVLEFDWNYGHRRDECSSKEHAEERLEKWQKTFYWAEFSNITVHKEIRYRTKVKAIEVEVVEK